VSKYGYSDAAAALWTPVPFLTVSLVTPFFGAMIDRIGNRMTFVVLSNITPAIAMLWAMAAPKCDDACWYAVFPMIILGISNIAILNIQQGSLIAYVVPPERMGVAFGLLYCMINLSYTIFPPILGLAQVHGGYNAAFFILFMIGIFGLAMTIFMYQVDSKDNNGIL
jgi:MFS family permease